MKNLTPIETLINLLDIQNNKFVFEVGSESPTKHLKKVTKKVPNLPGLYLVFTEKKDELTEKSHLYFTIENLDVELLYFGKAGGPDANGKIPKQNLVGRINNVVNNDIPRAIYWENEMRENNESSFIVYYILSENPSREEKQLYNYFDSNSLPYPRMNKKLGRKKK